MSARNLAIAASILLATCSSKEEGGGAEGPVSYRLGGVVNGLAGQGLVLASGDLLVMVRENGPFQFPAPLADGTAYEVTVFAQPTEPWQTCTVANASGTISGADIGSLAVACATHSHPLSLQVTGLEGAGLVLALDGESIPVDANGTRVLAPALPSGTEVDVQVQSQPVQPWQTCAVLGGPVKIEDRAATVAVSCSSNTYAVGGTLAGLQGGAVELALGDQSLVLTENGAFSFGGALPSGAPYAASVKQQPLTPPQRCTLRAASGVVSNAAIESLQVDCLPLLEVKGAVTGLVAGTALRLALNGDAELTVTSDGPFSFPDRLEAGQPYEVTVATQPSAPGQHCSLTNATGTSSTSALAVGVACHVTPSVLDDFKTCDTTIAPVDGRSGQWTVSGSFLMDGAGSASVDTTSPCGARLWVECLANCAVHVPRAFAGFPFRSDRAPIDLTRYAGLVVTGDVPAGAQATLGLLTGAVEDQAMSNPHCSWPLPAMTSGHAYVSFAGANNGLGCVPSAVTGLGVALFGNAPTLGSTMKITSIMLLPASASSGGALYGVGGMVSGLAGRGLVLRNGGGDYLEVASNGPFTFLTPLPSGASYDVRVQQQPVEPWQTCQVGSGFGAVGSAPVTSVAISCAPNRYPVRVAPTGIVAQGLLLHNNGGNALSVTSNTTHEFGSLIDSGATYEVTVSRHPTRQHCVVPSPTGTVKGGPALVPVTCYSAPELTVEGLDGGVALVFEDTGAQRYDAYLSTSATCTVASNGSCGFKLEDVRPGEVVGGRPRGEVLYAFVVATYPGGGTLVSEQSGGRPGPLVADGAIRSLAVGGDGSVYLGGNFTHLGAFTGSGVPLDLQTGHPSTPTFAQVEGAVRAVVPDGGGGWFVGGTFTRVAGAARRGLVHLRADGTLDTGWDPAVAGSVSALLRDGATLFVGGVFSSLGGASRSNLGAIRTSDAVATGFAADTDLGVNALELSGGRLLVGGQFSVIKGTPRRFAAAVDPLTGEVGAWAPDLGGSVHAIAADGATIYLGGAFTVLGGLVRNRIGAVSADRGEPTSFELNLTGTVRALALADGWLWIGGEMTWAGSTVRPGLIVARISAATSPRPVSVDGAVFAIARDADRLYVGGDLTLANGTHRSRLAVFNRATHELETFSPAVSGPVYALAAAGNGLYLGGGFDLVGGVERRGLASVTAEGLLRSWRPYPGFSVSSVSAQGSRVYAGGMGGVRAFDATTDAEVPTFSRAGYRVSQLVAGEGKVFTTATTLDLSGQRLRPVVLHPESGDLLPWQGWTTGGVSAVAVGASAVYFAGPFDGAGDSTSTSGALPRRHLAAFDLASGALLPWAPTGSIGVATLALTADTCYLGPSLAAFDLASGAPVTRVPSGAVQAYALHASGGRVYVGEYSGARAFDASTGAFTDWSHSVDGTVFAIASGNERVYAAGSFVRVDGSVSGCLAILPP